MHVKCFVLGWLTISYASNVFSFYFMWISMMKDMFICPCDFFFQCSSHLIRICVLMRLALKFRSAFWRWQVLKQVLNIFFNEFEGVKLQFVSPSELRHKKHWKKTTQFDYLVKDNTKSMTNAAGVTFCVIAHYICQCFLSSSGICLSEF